ncbi:response regulator [[Leptolyngbya] sp. PCC 7376]|uniref:ATP-binding response regulator n=1 Tax=[Leptolyngbya] sp. PCC 7376 TaxID=111781 RepID=UPI000685B1B9|nr:response regulator [[Leptolyngbya] sp. PCC 7376]
MPTILVIEDESAILEILFDILTAHGYKVLTALDAPKGMEIATERLPDLIVCDVGLPSLSGHEVLRHLKKNKDTVAIPLIFLTEHSSPEDVRVGMELGADDYLAKPFSTRRLLRAIDIRLKKQAQLKEYYEGALEQLRQNITMSLPHEFRTPLVGILGASEFLLADFENLESGMVRELLLDIQQSGDRLHQLIQKYLSFVQLQERYLCRSNGPEILEAPQLFSSQK